jgi:hypothetical protein
MSLVSENFVNFGEAQTVEAGDVQGGQQIPERQNVAIANYSFANNGGAVSATPILLTLSKPIPQDSSITRVAIIPAGIVGAASISVGVNTNNDAVTTATLTANTLNSSSVRAGDLITQIKVVISAAPITAGAIQFLVVYL